MEAINKTSLITAFVFAKFGIGNIAFENFTLSITLFLKSTSNGAGSVFMFKNEVAHFFQSYKYGP